MVIEDDAMKGKILGFNVDGKIGHISSGDSRYEFTKDDWMADLDPKSGMAVDFIEKDGNAVGVYPVEPNIVKVQDKDRLVAALLAIFLGAIGIHKFYLGYKTQGIIMHL